ncbi:MAG: hypothetical protein QOD91_895 [Frankiales bacterium]|nr:hypothetical protein [Frankiales bacterium]
MSFVFTRSRLAAAGTTMALIAGTVGLTGVVTVAAPVAAHAAVPAPPAGFSTTWSDDFTGASGTGADPNWAYDTGAGSSFGTGEIETMTNSTANVYQDGASHLVLKALHSGTDPNSGWTSGRIETPATFGAAAGGVVRMESVIQQPNVTTANGAGYWPAFWMLGSTLRSGVSWPGSGEVDILEDINGRSSVFGTLHCGTNPGGPCNESSGIGSGEHACPGCQTGFHDYAVEIDRSVSPEQIRWYLDGVNYFTLNATQVDAATWTNAVDHSFFIIYDLAMGGGFPSAFGGGPNASTVSGGAMVVDSVAVYNKGPVSGTYATATATGAITSGIAGKCMEDSAGNTANATPVVIDSCGAAGQTWSTYSDSTLRTGGKCLDAAAAGTANGTKLQVYDCNGSPAQLWQAHSGGYLNPQSCRCIDDPAGSATNGTQLQLYDCNGLAEELWSTPGGGGGTTPPANIAQGKPTTASSVENAGNPAANATDGNTGTRWSSAFSDPQWLQVDLGQTYNISQVTLNWEAAYARAFQIQTSADGTNWTSVYSTTTGTGGVQTLTVSGSGRYLRMYGTQRATAYGYSLWELSVAGTPGSTSPVLLSQGRTATASSTENAGTPAAAAVDGNTGTRWSSAFSDPQWLQVDLGATRTISQVVLNWEAAAGKAFQIQTSPDGTNWTSIYSTTTGTGGVQTLSVSGSGRYVRMYGTARATAYGYSLWELQVFGS